MDTRSEIVSNIPDEEHDREPEFVAAAVVVVVAVVSVAVVDNTPVVLVPELRTIEPNHSDLLYHTCEDQLADTSFDHFDIDFEKR